VEANTLDGQIPESLFQKYHVALVKALGKDAEKVFVKLGRNLGSQIAKEGRISLKELEEELADYLQNDLKLGEKIKVNIDNHTLNIEVEGCRICPANEILRSQGASGACFLPGILTGALKPIKEVKRATVVGAEKYEIGHCRMQLKLE